MRSAFGKPRGNLTSRLARQTPEGKKDLVYTTREKVEEQGAKTLVDRFTTAHSSPLYLGKLLGNIGYMGKGPAVQQILKGMYEFPEDCSAEVRQLMIEAEKIFEKASENVILTFVHQKDFQGWWLTSNENISSSKSGAHFGHYKAAAFKDYLSALHFSKLNLAPETGLPLERWGHGLTVLLKKEFGATYMDKLRTICLFEADFNWLQKLMFSKRMIASARTRGIILAEQCPTSGVDQNQGTTLKVFHNDIHRTMYIPSQLVSADLDNCYDAVQHAISCIALHAFGVPDLAISLILTSLQTMFF